MSPAKRNFIGIKPIRALVWAAFINVCIAPILLFLIMLISNEPAVMGRRVNSRAIELGELDHYGGEVRSRGRARCHFYVIRIRLSETDLFAADICGLR